MISWHFQEHIEYLNNVRTKVLDLNLIKEYILLHYIYSFINIEFNETVIDLK